MGTAIMVTSGKGGTGKTSLVAGVGACLAALGKKVLCMDLDVGLRSLDLVLGMDDRVLMDFTDAAHGRCALSDAARQPEVPGLYLLTAPAQAEPPDFPLFRRLMDEAKEQFDFVLLDSPAGLGDNFRLASSGADKAIVVSTTDPVALRDAQRAVTELVRSVPDLHLVMNRVETKTLRGMGATIDQAMDTAGLPLLGVVPEDRQVRMAAVKGTPLPLYTSRGAVRAYLNIAKRLLGRRAPLERF